MTESRYHLNGVEIKRGQRLHVNIDMGSIYDFTNVNMPIEIIRGKKKGPTLFVCSTIHGDEISGIEIVRRLLAAKELREINGMLIAIPVVNIFGFNDRSRYLPDRRDLNRCFPGLKHGSLASQVAYKFMREIVVKSDFGIDLHTGAFHRCNHPQIRADISDEATFDLAKTFGAPVILNANLRDGSLRSAVAQEKIPMILFEAGEALRFDEKNIKIGVEGILNVMRSIGMIKPKSSKNPPKEPFIALSSSWVRAPKGGIHTSHKKLGDIVTKGDALGEIANPLGDNKTLVKAHETGMIIGVSMLPLVNKGDALFHIACERRGKKAVVPIFTTESYENIDHVKENIDPVNS